VDVVPYADSLLIVVLPTPHARREHPSHKPLSELLYELAEEAFHQHNDVDFILLEAVYPESCDDGLSTQPFLRYLG